MIRQIKRRPQLSLSTASCHKLALLPYEMPSHDNSSKMYQRLAQHEDGLEIIGEEELFPPPKKDPELHEDDKTRRSPSLAVIIPFVASFYFCSCGIERLFQSMAS